MANTINNKYELLPKGENGLYQVRALIDFGDVCKGDIYAYKVDTEPKPKFDESAFKETWPDLHKQFCVAPEPGIKIKIEVNK